MTDEELAAIEARAEAAERERDQLKRGHDELHRLVSQAVADKADAEKRLLAAEAQVAKHEQHMTALYATLDRHHTRIAALVAAGDRLAEGYAAHDDDCPYPYKSVVTDDDCTCGLNAARDAWERAKEKEQP